MFFSGSSPVKSRKEPVVVAPVARVPEVKKACTPPLPPPVPQVSKPSVLDALSQVGDDSEVFQNCISLFAEFEGESGADD